MGRAEKSDEAGIVALEVLLVLPVLGVILLGAVLGLDTAARNYFQLRTQAEVQQEVPLAFARIMDDCLAATSLRRGSRSESIRLYAGERILKEYFVHEDSKGVRKLVENDIKLPLTGNHAWAAVAVKSFGFKEVDPLGRPGLYRLWLEGTSSRRGIKPYKLTTEVYIPPKRQGGSP